MADGQKVTHEEVRSVPCFPAADPPPYQTAPDGPGLMESPPPYPSYQSIEDTGSQTDLIALSFDDDSVRRAFIRKVFSVVTLQLLVTFSVVCVFTFSDTVKKAVQENIWVFYSSVIIFFVESMCLSFCKSYSRSYPWNLISLSVVTLTMSYMVGTLASFYDTSAVVIAMGSTLAISFTIIIFSAQTRVGFTICNFIIIVLLMDVLMFAFFCIFYYSTVLSVVYGCLGALLYSLFLSVDSMLVIGREKYRLSPEEYIFAAFIIYMDIILIFIYILMIFGGGSRN